MDGGPAREFHLLTRHGAAVDRSRLVAFQPLDPTNRPRPFKEYVGRTATPLPRDFAPSTVRAVDVLTGRGRPEATAPLDDAALARLLFLTAGVTRVSTGAAFDEPTYFRTAMSAGNLHPIEVYAVSHRGVHHFGPLDFGLVLLRDGDQRPALAAALASDTVRDAPVALVLTGIPWRTEWKYGERGYRHLWWDAGTMLANLFAAACSAGIDARLYSAFVDDAVSRLLGIDGIEELPLVVVALGAGNGQGGERAAAREIAGAADPAPLALDTVPVSAMPIEFPLVTETHRAGALHDANEVREWRAALARVTTPTGGSTGAPSSDRATDASIDEVIVQRGSSRLMRRETAARDLLLWALDVATQPVPFDVETTGTVLEHDVSVHGIEGVSGGLYRLAAGRLDQVRAGDSRELAARLCLDQPLGGDAAYTAFHAAPLDRVLDAAGTRAYRVAQLEAGVVSGRLALAAFALGYGATGLTFYDDLVSRVFETDAAPMLATAVGVPDYRNRRGAARPGQPAALPGYARLMQRLSVQLRAR